MNKKTIGDYTESEFMSLVARIIEDDGTEREQDEMLESFILIAGHPAGSDLIYYPESVEDGSPENIVKKVKEWRAANGKPGFKSN